MVRHSAAGHVQHVIIVAGDSDFIPAIEATKESGATVTIWCGDKNTIHKELIDMADIVHQFDWKKIPRKKKKSSLKLLKSDVQVKKEPVQQKNKPKGQKKYRNKKKGSGDKSKSR